MKISVDATLGCGQAHRWIKKGDSWEGVIDNSIVTVTQTEDGFGCTGCNNSKTILNYFRSDDDLDEIYRECSASDPYVSSLAERCPGLRLLRQDPWECIATYLLATNANVRRIGMMVENVCRTFGRDLGGRYSFPRPEEITETEERIGECKLGYRAERFTELAHLVTDGKLNPYEIRKMSYEKCIETLLTVNGIGPKVADCIALFSMDHLEAFPIDARIERILKEKYGQCGNYGKLSEFARNRFGKYAGYSQELLYHSGFIDP